MKKEEILIVGGTGFLGKEILKILFNYNISVIGQKEVGSFEPKNHKYYKLNVCKSEDIDTFLKEKHFSHLVFLAWPLTPPHNTMEHVIFSAASINFVYKFSNANPNARVLFVGSIHETGIQKGKVLPTFNESSPDNLYGISKKYVYDCLNVFLRDVSFCWARLSNVYGIGDHSHKLFSTLIHNSIIKKDLKLNSPHATIDFVHVKDAAYGLFLALFSNYTGIINIGGGKGYTLESIKKIVNSKIKNKGLSKISIPSLDVSDSGAILDITASTKLLGYLPSIKLENVLNELIDSIKKVKNERN